MSVSCHSVVSGITHLSHVLLMNHQIAFSGAPLSVCIERWNIYLTDERPAILISALTQRTHTLKHNAIFCRGKYKCSKSLPKPNTLIFWGAVLHRKSNSHASFSMLGNNLVAPHWILILVCKDNWLHCFQTVVHLKTEGKRRLLQSQEEWTKLLVALCWKQQDAVVRLWRENTALEKHHAFTANHYSLVLWL